MPGISIIFTIKQLHVSLSTYTLMYDQQLSEDTRLENPYTPWSALILEICDNEDFYPGESIRRFWDKYTLPESTLPLYQLLMAAKGGAAQAIALPHQTGEVALNTYFRDLCEALIAFSYVTRCEHERTNPKLLNPMQSSENHEGEKIYLPPAYLPWADLLLGAWKEAKDDAPFLVRGFWKCYSPLDATALLFELFVAGRPDDGHGENGRRDDGRRDDGRREKKLPYYPGDRALDQFHHDLTVALAGFYWLTVPPAERVELVWE